MFTCFSRSALMVNDEIPMSYLLPIAGMLAFYNERVDLLRSLMNSGIFTGGVLLGTLVFGVLGGYALAMLHFRGRGVLFSAMLLVLVVPFQLSMIPLYVLIARDYGLGDTYLGMILPFAINSVAVLIFRQFFLQPPDHAAIEHPDDAVGQLELEAVASGALAEHGEQDVDAAPGELLHRLLAEHGDLPAEAPMIAGQCTA